MTPGRIDKARGFHATIWALAERMDYSDRFPRRFWRWLLKRYDAKFGHQLEYDEEQAGGRG